MTGQSTAKVENREERRNGERRIHTKYPSRRSVTRQEHRAERKVASCMGGRSF